MILLSSSLETDPPETTVSIFFSRNCDSHNQNSQLKIENKGSWKVEEAILWLLCKILRDSKV